jgi:CRP-like cAMP-binding protein
VARWWLRGSKPADYGFSKNFYLHKMDGVLVITNYFERYVQLSESEKELLASSFIPVKIKRRQLINQPGFIVKHRNYVLKGAFRGYLVSEQGQDYTVAFAIEDWWIGDYNSYIFQQPATMFVEALEDSIILQLSYEEEQRLKRESHTIETFFRIRAEYMAAYAQQRIRNNLMLSAEERYNTFIQKYSKVAERVPQYALASYLGMTTQFLSKIRHQKLKRS